MGCHAGNGIDIISEAAGLSDAELETVILEGTGYMPPQTNLSTADIRDVIAFIRTCKGRFGYSFVFSRKNARLDGLCYSR